MADGMVRILFYDMRSPQHQPPPIFDVVMTSENYADLMRVGANFVVKKDQPLNS